MKSRRILIALGRNFAIAKIGVQCANSANVTSLTGKNGALPATAESIIERTRSEFFHISLRMTGFGKSV